VVRRQEPHFRGENINVARSCHQCCHHRVCAAPCWRKGSRQFARGWGGLDWARGAGGSPTAGVTARGLRRVRPHTHSPKCTRWSPISDFPVVRIPRPPVNSGEAGGAIGFPFAPRYGTPGGCDWQGRLALRCVLAGESRSGRGAALFRSSLARGGCAGRRVPWQRADLAGAGAQATRCAHGALNSRARNSLSALDRTRMS
jgi:hypothetical protein